MSILVVGSVGFDYIETPFGNSGKIIGGAGTHICLSASFFSNKVSLVSMVGKDFPTSFMKPFIQKKINTRGIKVDADNDTFFWSGKYNSDLNTKITKHTQLNVLKNFEPEIPPHITKPEFLILGNMSPTIQNIAIDSLKQKPKIILMDTMNFWMNHEMDMLKTVLKKVDVLSVKDEEARELSGEYSLVRAAAAIKKLGPKYVIIRKGDHGTLLFSGNYVFFAPSLPLVDIFDPTGAGDTFNGGFIGFLSQKGDIRFDNMKRAVIFGSALASFCVEKFGTEKLLEINQASINDRVQQFIDMVQFNYELDEM
jgi:sugar/nucleoside kinase (ribokinase family)